MLNDNRFLGLHQVWFGLLLTPASLALLSQFTTMGWHRLIVPAFLMAWLLVEALFLPRRLAIHRLARRRAGSGIARVSRRRGHSPKRKQKQQKRGAFGDAGPVPGESDLDRQA